MPTNILVLWSGGLDSTYLIQHLLDTTPDARVRAIYVQITNNEDKVKTELAAIKKMVPVFKEKYGERFIYDGKVCSIEINDNVYSPDKSPLGFSQIPCWIAGVIYGLKHDTTHVALGYVMNDDAISYLEEIR